MATVLPPRQESRHLQNLISAAGFRFGENQKRQKLMAGLSPEQQQATQGLPLSQLTNLVTGLAQNQFLSPLQKSQQANQGILSNRRGNFLQGLGSRSLGNLTSEEALQGSRLGLFNAPPAPRQPAASNIGLTPREIREKNLGTTGRGTAPITFDTDFTDKSGKRVRDTTTVRVPKGFESQAQDLGNKYGTLDPSEIFASQADIAAENSGLISFNDDGALIIDVQETAVDPSEITSAFPDIATAAMVKGGNPIDALEAAFANWDSFNFEDKGEGALNVAETVSLGTAAPKPTPEEQGIVILSSMASLIDDQETQDEIAQVLNNNDPEQVRAAIEALRGSFSGRKRRPTRSR